MNQQIEQNLFEQYRSVGEHPQMVNPSNSLELTTNGVCKKFIHGRCQNRNCPNPHNKSKIKPCNNFEAYGKCQYGEKCNFSHETRVCSFFMRGICEKVILKGTQGAHCPCRHVYKSCHNFDLGFCVKGANCDLKHITRRLCWDYMYGFCEKGSRCDLFHPKIYQEEDFKLSIRISQSTGRGILKYVCMNCGVIGHKVTTCPKRKEINPLDTFKCGLCGSIHTYVEDCNNNAS